MNVHQAIQASANIVRITNIAPGDVYKRFDDSSGYDDRVYLGIVQAVHNDGNQTIIQALEYCYKYSTLSVELKVLRGDKDYALFPASPEDLNRELDGVIDRKSREIESKTDEIAKLTKEIAEVEKLLSGEAQKELKAMSYTEVAYAELAGSEAA
jgi:hypothetical protein